MAKTNNRPIRINVYLTQKEAEILDSSRKDIARSEYIRRVIKGAKSAPIDPAYVAALEDENAAFAAREDKAADLTHKLTAENERLTADVSQLRAELQEAVEGSHIWQEEYQTCCFKLEAAREKINAYETVLKSARLIPM